MHPTVDWLVKDDEKVRQIGNTYINHAYINHAFIEDELKLCGLVGPISRSVSNYVIHMDRYRRRKKTSTNLDKRRI